MYHTFETLNDKVDGGNKYTSLCLEGQVTASQVVVALSLPSVLHTEKII